MAKRIPESVYVEWHKTGRYLHRPSYTNGDTETCNICNVNYERGQEYGCQGMRFDEWYKIYKAKPKARKKTKMPVYVYKGVATIEVTFDVKVEGAFGLDVAEEKLQEEAARIVKEKLSGHRFAYDLKPKVELEIGFPKKMEDKIKDDKYRVFGD